MAQAQPELPQLYPQPGWVEHDPMEIWRTQLATAREALAKAGIAPTPVRAVGITNQRETTTCCGTARPGSPCTTPSWARPARRTCLRPTARTGPRRHHPGQNRPAGRRLLSGTKLQWMLTMPGAREAAERGELAFGTVDSWLIWEDHPRPGARH